MLQRYSFFLYFCRVNQCGTWTLEHLNFWGVLFFILELKTP